VITVVNRLIVKQCILKTRSSSSNGKVGKVYGLNETGNTLLSCSCTIQYICKHVAGYAYKLSAIISDDIYRYDDNNLTSTNPFTQEIIYSSFTVSEFS